MDPAEALELGAPWTRRYIYNQSMCGRCNSPIKTWDMSGRTVYCCLKCQPLKENINIVETQIKGNNRSKLTNSHEKKKVPNSSSISISPTRRKEMGKAVTAVEFVSHCAPDDHTDGKLSFYKMTVKQLKEKLSDLELSTKGLKSDLVDRLVSHFESKSSIATKNAKHGETKEKEYSDQDPMRYCVLDVRTPPQLEVSKPMRQRKRRTKAHSLDHEAAVYPERYTIDFTDLSGKAVERDDSMEKDTENRIRNNQTVRPGTHFMNMPGKNLVANAAEAAAEKAMAGENRAIEHVALYDETQSNARMEPRKRSKRNNRRS